MRDVFFCVSVDDVGMAGYSTPEHVENLVRFWESEGLKGTLFVVPRWEGKELGTSAAYAGVLRDVIRRGHEVAQHGLDHGRFQTGIPPQMILDMSHEGPAREYLAKHRKEIEAALTVKNLRETLATGRRILEDAMGTMVTGFRAPSGSICDALYEALSAEGYQYDSSRIVQAAAWDLINDPNGAVTPHPITRERFNGFQTCDALRTWPISAEYTWYLKRDHYQAFLDLAKHDFDACLSAGLPFVPVCHVSPVHEGDEGCGFDFYRELITYARERAEAAGGQLVGITLSELCARWTLIW